MEKESSGPTGENGLQPETSPEGSFAQFWRLYPNKKAKLDAQKAWKQVKPDPDVVLAAIENQLAYRLMRHQRGRWNPEWPLPASWLRGRRWEDVLEGFTPPAAPDPPPPRRERGETECRVGYGQEMDGILDPPYPHGLADETGYCLRCRTYVIR